MITKFTFVTFSSVSLHVVRNCQKSYLFLFFFPYPFFGIIFLDSKKLTLLFVYIDCSYEHRMFVTDLKEPNCNRVHSKRYGDRCLVSIVRKVGNIFVFRILSLHLFLFVRLCIYLLTTTTTSKHTYACPRHDDVELSCNLEVVFAVWELFHHMLFFPLYYCSWICFFGRAI